MIFPQKSSPRGGIFHYNINIARSKFGEKLRKLLSKKRRLKFFEISLYWLRKVKNRK